MGAMTMKAIRWVVPVLVAVLPTLLWAAPGDGIQGTPHDFSGFGSPPTGLCTFCHTSHTAGSEVLLWNHTLSTNTFSWAVPETMSGTMMVPMKDNSIVESFAKDLDCPTPLLSATMPIYAAAISQGRIDQDVASLLAVLEQMVGHARS